jgi:ABC-type ATPase with predicted acetyltransferase domain
MTTKTSTIVPDHFTDFVSQAFDYQFDGVTSFNVPEFVPPSGSFKVGLIIGSSGSGKTTILKEHYGHTEKTVEWDADKAIVSHFDTPEEAVEKCFAVGLGSIPTLCKPFHVLSNGEQYRAVMARSLGNNMIMDEFTSVVNRETAKSLCVAMKKFILKKNISGVVLASCHTDIVEFLDPDWVFDCNSGTFSTKTKDISDTTKIAEVRWYV